MSVVLYHVAVDEEGRGKDCHFVDGNGRKWTVPFDTPTEFENEYMASKIVEHCHWMGIIMVHSTRDRAGVHYDMEDARKRAQDSLNVSEKACINDYVMNQMQDRVRQNFPPLPPQGRALECCIKHKYNLLRAGIRLIGWEPPYAMEDPGLGATAIGTGLPSNIQEQINQLQQQLIAQNALIIQLLTGSKMKAPAPAPAPVEAPTFAPPIDTVPPTAPINDDVPDEYERDQQQQAIRL